jgi:hypothetical protein
MRTLNAFGMNFLQAVFLMACAVFVMYGLPALAQESATQISGGSVWAAISPYLFTAVSAAVVAVLTWATNLFHKWTGIQIEARHREALHSAAMTGVAAAFNKIGQKADTITLDVRSIVVKEGVDWVMKSVPDALGYFNLSPQALATLIESKIELLLQGKATQPAR